MEGRTKAGTDGGPPLPASGFEGTGLLWGGVPFVGTAPLLVVKLVDPLVAGGPLEGGAPFVSSPGRFRGGRVGRVRGGGFFTAAPAPGAGVPAGGFNAGNFWSGRGDCAAPLPVPPFMLIAINVVLYSTDQQII